MWPDNEIAVYWLGQLKLNVCLHGREMRLEYFFIFVSIRLSLDNCKYERFSIWSGKITVESICNFYSEFSVLIKLLLIQYVVCPDGHVQNTQVQNSNWFIFSVLRRSPVWTPCWRKSFLRTNSWVSVFRYLLPFIPCRASVRWFSLFKYLYLMNFILNDLN